MATTAKGPTETISGWFAGRVPDAWFTGAPEVDVDGDEIVVVGELTEPRHARGASTEAKAAARAGRIKQFREDTRDPRMRIAEEAQHRFGRRVAWGARCGDERQLFTTLSLPVMTRLRMPERSVLDTLIDAGVARSRSEALAWCVRLVGANSADWISQLKDALTEVQRVRASGPDAP